MTTGMSVAIGWTGTVRDIRKVDLVRTEGSNFKIRMQHADGTTELVMDGTSGKLDQLSIERDQEGAVRISVTGKGVKRGAPR